MTSEIEKAALAASIHTATPSSATMTDHTLAIDAVPPQAGSIISTPRSMDVVGARGGSWQAKHPGNVVYRDLVLEGLRQLQTSNNDPKEAAREIINRIRQESGGVFLFQLQSGSGWRVMDDHTTLQKVLWALKNAEGRECLLTNTITPKRKWSVEHRERPVTIMSRKVGAKITLDTPLNQTPKRTPKPTQKILSSTVKSTPSPPPKILKTEPFVESKRYEAKSGPMMIPEHTLNLLNVMCNQSCPDTALVALDTPLKAKDGTDVDESDRERQVRLQLRHRYIAAMSIGVAPLTFSIELMKLWGGEITYATPIEPMVSSTPPLSASQKSQETVKAPLITPSNDTRPPDVSNTPPFNTLPYWDDTYDLCDIPINDEPGFMDVLLGRGGGANNWDGNRRFREKVLIWKTLYEETPMGSKYNVAKRLVQSWILEGGRFLERISIDNHSWVRVSNERAYKKTFQALRAKSEGLNGTYSLRNLSLPDPLATASRNLDDDFVTDIDDYELI